MKPYKCVNEEAILKWILQPIMPKPVRWYHGDMKRSTHPSSPEVWTPKTVSKIKQSYMLRCTTFWIERCVKYRLGSNFPWHVLPHPSRELSIQVSLSLKIKERLTSNL